MRLDGVEIKVNFREEGTGAALDALGLPDDRPPWLIHFCEDVNPGVGVATPLLDRGVVLRARVRPGDDDVTVKLRPARGSQLPPRWLDGADRDRVAVEADWAGARHVLAASHTEEVPEGVIPAVAAGARPVTDLLTPSQQEFLAEGALERVNVAALTVLPPVTALRWKTVPAAPPELGLRAERWTVGPLDFLELSLVVPPDRAVASQTALARFVDSVGLPVPPEPESKTSTVMRRLVAMSLGVA